MDPPRRRSRGSWPRDRPIRWSGVVRNLSWFVVASAALVIQIGLALPILLFDVLGRDDGAVGLARIVLSLVWGGLTLFAAWSWVVGRWRVVLAPILTIAAGWIVWTMLSSG